MIVGIVAAERPVAVAVAVAVAAAVAAVVEGEVDTAVEVADTVVGEGVSITSAGDVVVVGVQN